MIKQENDQTVPDSGAPKEKFCTICLNECEKKKNNVQWLIKYTGNVRFLHLEHKPPHFVVVWKAVVHCLIKRTASSCSRNIKRKRKKKREEGKCQSKIANHL